MSGKKLRLARLIHPEEKKICMVPLDHGTTLGPIAGIEDYVGTIGKVVSGGADAVVMHKGLLREVAEHPELANGNYLLHLSVSTCLGPDANQKVLVSSVEEAIKLGADGVSIHVNVGTTTEVEMIRDLGMVSDACREWGMPLLAMMYARGGNIKDSKDPVYVAHVARLAEELGADLVKVDYPGTIAGLQQVIEGVRIPVVIAGGNKMNQMEPLLRMVQEAMDAGAAGVSIGRNIFQHADPALATRLIRKIVYNEMKLEEVLGLLQEQEHVVV